MAEAALQLSNREFRIGRALSTTLSVFARNALPFSLVAGMAWMPAELITFWGEQHANPNMQLVALAAMIIVITFVYPFGTAILLHATFQTMRGQPVSLRMSLRHGLARFPQLLGVSFFTTIGVLSGMMLFIIPGIVLLTMWYVALPVCVVEKRGIFDSLNRSATLTRGYRWQVFGTFFLALFALGVIEALLEAGATSLAGAETALVVSIVWGGVAQGLTAVLDVVLYHDLRVAKEGLDIEKIASVFD